MADLQGWQKVAREIGDWDWNGDMLIPQCNHSATVGDWLPAEAAAKEILRLREELEIWKMDYALMSHKVITCGVAADHPDPKLTLRADYMKWNSPQAERVRALRERADEDAKEILRLRERNAVLEKVRKMAQATHLEHPDDCWGQDGCVCGLNRLYDAIAAADQQQETDR